MKEQTRRIAFSAVLCALSVLLLYISSIAPTLKLALVAAAGILPAAAVMRFGTASGFALYAAVSVLALVLLPNKGGAFLYIFLFGHYPMLKSLIERIRKVWLEWVLKIALFNVLFTILILLFSEVVTDSFTAVTTRIPAGFALPALYLAGNIAFAAYDAGFTGLIAAFGQRFKLFK